MSQALPSVVRAYMPEENTLIILEQPELHLHPAAHGDLAELFAISAKQHNYDYLIETHSETFVLRLRNLIAQGRLSHKDVLIYWIGEEEGNDKKFLKRINVNDSGEVDYWPPGIFSESFEEVKALGEAQYEKKKSNL